jgi:hypothetical protein
MSLALPISLSSRLRSRGTDLAQRMMNHVTSAVPTTSNTDWAIEALSRHAEHRTKV